jgi:undecaprenyl-diphosphatase
MPFTERTWKPFGALVLLGLLGTAVMMMTLAEIHEHLGGRHIERWDAHVQDRVHDDATPRLTRAAFALSRIGSPETLVPVIPILAALLWWRGFRHAAIVWTIATVGASLLVLLLKLHFRRIRPDLPWAFTHEPSFSFPSGHSVFAVVVYGTLIHLGLRLLSRTWERVAVVLVAGGLILGIGLSRIYLGVHYPSDVAAGYYVGAVWLGTVIGADWYVRRYRSREQGVPPSPPPI